MTNASWGPFYIILAASLWSIDVLMRQSLGLPSLSIVFYEHLLACVILIPLAYRSFVEMAKCSWKDWLALGWVSMLGGFLGTFFYTQALYEVRYMEFSIVVLLQQLQPIFAILLARVILKEKMPKQFLMWACVALLGAYMITVKDLAIQFQPDHNNGRAALFALLAAFSWGSSVVFGKFALEKISFKTATTVRFFMTTIWILIAIAIFPKELVAPSSLTQQQWLTLSLMIIFTGLGAIFVYYYGLQFVEAKVCCICELFFPISAVLINIFYYKSEFSATQVMGIVILLVAIFSVSHLGRSETSEDS